MQSQQFLNDYLAGVSQARADAATLVPAMAELARNAANNELAEALRDQANALSLQADRLDPIAGPYMAVEDCIAVLAAKALRSIATYERGIQRDMAMIAAVQRIQHYEIATFGTLAAYAKMLGRHDEKRVLGAILEDSRALDEDLTIIATSIIEPLDAIAA